VLVYKGLLTKIVPVRSTSTQQPSVWGHRAGTWCVGSPS